MTPWESLLQSNNGSSIIKQLALIAFFILEYFGRWTLDAGLWTLDSTLWTLGSGHWTLSLTVSEQNQNPVSDSA